MKTIKTTILLFVCLFTNSLMANDTIRIVFAGDIVLGLNYPENKIQLPPNDGKDLFANVKDFMATADFGIGNLEGVLLDKGGNPKNCKSNCYRFRMPERYAQHLYDAGFKVMNLANNHARDFGDIGAQSSCRVLKEHNIKYMGLKNSCEYTTYEVNGINIGICGFAPNTGTVSVNDYKKAEELVQMLDSICDLVVVVMHAGAEGAQHNRVTRKREFYLGENRGNVHEFAHKMIDAGADMVVGHGPHVVRAVELYKNRFIAYSLGNFCTPYGISKAGKAGYAPLLRIDVNSKGEFVGGEILSAIQTGNLGPIPDAERKVIKEIKNLTSVDFPESPINITDNGKIEIIAN